MNTESGLGRPTTAPTRTLWNTLDLLCRDPDGYEVVLTAAVADDLKDQRIAETVRQSVPA